jgi:hypothetical protein
MVQRRTSLTSNAWSVKTEILGVQNFCRFERVMPIPNDWLWQTLADKDSSGHFPARSCRMRICTGKSSARMGRKRPRCSRTRSLHNPTSQSSARGPLQQGRVSLHKGDTLEKICARHRTVRRQNPNNRNRLEKYDHNRAVRTGGMIAFLPMTTPPASLVA